ncbi:MAG: glycosyltransferase family 4 protein [Firmicutes bacterium]|nr:glycosyltransferase family 4 protein [Bacillota bacterium]
MRVLIINHYAIPPTEPGGTRHHSLAKELVSRGHEVAIVAASFHHMTRRRRPEADNSCWFFESIDGARFVWLRVPAYQGNSVARVWNMIVFALRTLGLLRSHDMECPDVVIGSSPHLFAAWAGERLAQCYGVPFVLEVRDLWPETLVRIGKMPRWHPLVLLMSMLERWLYRRASRIITLLPGASKYIASKGVPSEHIVHIPNGTDFSLAAKPAMPPAESRATFIYVGAHGVANALDTVLEAACILRDKGYDSLRFRFVGDGPEKSRLRDKASRIGFQNVVFDDPVPKGQVYSEIAKADAGLLVMRDSPLYDWGMSTNKIFDYMASARPVIFSGNTPYDIVRSAGCGFSVPAEDAAGLAEAIEAFLQLPKAERIEMGLRGRRYVEENHNFSILASKLEQLLREVLEAQPKD